MSLSLSSLSPSVTPLFPTANGAHAFVIGFVDPSSLHLLSHGRVLVAAHHHHHIDHGLCLGLGRQMSFAGTAARRLPRHPIGRDGLEGLLRADRHLGCTGAARDILMVFGSPPSPIRPPNALAHSPE